MEPTLGHLSEFSFRSRLGCETFCDMLRQQKLRGSFPINRQVVQKILNYLPDRNLGLQRISCSKPRSPKLTGD